MEHVLHPGICSVFQAGTVLTLLPGALALPCLPSNSRVRVCLIFIHMHCKDLPQLKRETGKQMQTLLLLLSAL